MKIYVINLDKDVDRLNAISRQLESFGLSWERIPAIYGKDYKGGEGSDVPLRTLIPLSKQRCRHLIMRFIHENARESFKLVGISAEPREISTRGYR
jgi:GR25 family glycosyltransferase involved in LPS biosynthesis